MAKGISIALPMDHWCQLMVWFDQFFAFDITFLFTLGVNSVIMFLYFFWMISINNHTT